MMLSFQARETIRLNNITSNFQQPLCCCLNWFRTMSRSFLMETHSSRCQVKEIIILHDIFLKRMSHIQEIKCFSKAKEVSLNWLRETVHKNEKLIKNKNSCFWVSSQRGGLKIRNSKQTDEIWEFLKGRRKAMKSSCFP